MNKRFLTIAIIGCLLLQTALPVAAQMSSVRYVIEDLGVLSAEPSNYSLATGINSVGQATGITRGEFGEYRLFRWTNGTMENLGIISGTPDARTGATEINDFGWITGTLKTPTEQIHAFLYKNSTLIDLGGGGAEFPGGENITRGRGINNFGEVVGYQGENNPRAFYYDGATMRNLNSMIPAGSGWILKFANDINDKRQIVGGGSNSNSEGGTRAYRYTVGAGSILAIFGGNSFSEAYSISNLGKTVGGSTNLPFSNGFAHADEFGTLQLGAPAPCGGNSKAKDVNARGTIVGWYYPITGQSGCPQAFNERPVVWTQFGVAFELNNLIDPSLGWTLTEANSINDRGQIVGVGTRVINGFIRTRAYRLTPIRPENNQVSDFDGDGKSDISVFRPADGDWHLLRSATQDWTPVHFGAAGDKLAPGDFDGDGRTDPAVYRGGQWFILESGSGNFRAAQFGLPDDVPTPGDFDADGRTDLAVFRPSNGYWYYILSSDNQFRAVQFGASGDKPVVGDYDADGRADHAVYRPSNGSWYVLRSTLGFTGVQFGVASDRPVQGDYDGDGRTDFAVFRPSDGVWYLLRSQSGFAAAQFGVSTDEPVPGDYDGDGKFDLGIYRSGLWYLRHSRNGFDAAQQFGQAGDKPIPAAYNPAGN
ncbi:MAG TPA: FG-GAP-like repeat-containing protein [Pyrinomonadaceae bacterium]|nr:FG-GAP-like repeat-containing protein [Pyrinomonadaceae bacterium]